MPPRSNAAPVVLAKAERMILYKSQFQGQLVCRSQAAGCILAAVVEACARLKGRTVREK
jgi:hypothetical protein